MTYSAPIHERASPVWGAYCRQRKGDILLRPNVGYQMATIQPSHRMGQEIDPTSSSSRFELFMEPVCSRRYGTGSISSKFDEWHGAGGCNRPRHRGNDDFCSDYTSQYAKDI
jgi:hypothetical protein